MNYSLGTAVTCEVFSSAVHVLEPIQDSFILKVYSTLEKFFFLHSHIEVLSPYSKKIKMNGKTVSLRYVSLVKMSFTNYPGELKITP